MACGIKGLSFVYTFDNLRKKKHLLLAMLNDTGLYHTEIPTNSVSEGDRHSAMAVKQSQEADSTL